MKWYDPHAPESRTELWLWEMGRLRATPEAVRVLDRCRRRSEVEFATALISTPGWFCWDESSLANQQWTLTPRAEIGRYTVSFVLRSRHDQGWSSAIDILSDAGPGRRRPTDSAREDAIRAAVREYHVLEEHSAKGVGRHFHDLLVGQANRVNRLSLERYQQLITPGLVWVLLDEKFWFDAKTGAAARQLRLYHWLRERGHTLAPEAINLLAQCDWHAAVRFALPILGAGQWRFGGRRAVSGSIGIEVKRVAGRHEVDFAIGRLDSSTQRPTVVEIRKPVSVYRPKEPDYQRMREQSAREAGYPYLLVEEAEADSEGRSWAELLRKAREERDERSRRTRDTAEGSTGFHGPVDRPEPPPPQ